MIAINLDRLFFMLRLCFRIVLLVRARAVRALFIRADSGLAAIHLVAGRTRCETPAASRALQHLYPNSERRRGVERKRAENGGRGEAKMQIRLTIFCDCKSCFIMTAKSDRIECECAGLRGGGGRTMQYNQRSHSDE